jgi:hypothetical protein
MGSFILSRKFLRWLTPLLVIALMAIGWTAWVRVTFPGDHVPLGAYMRIVAAVTADRPEDLFAYTEDAAQHACYTILHYRKRALARVRTAFPSGRRAQYEQSYAPFADVADGKDVFARYARTEGWMMQLRRDLSGTERVEVVGARATVVTARGTRYSFRRRPNGIWGMTAFTATLVSEAERAARDLALLEKAAEDYERSAGVR